MAKRINSRRKGAAAERELAELFATTFSTTVRRGLSQAGGASCRPDIDLSQSPLEKIHVECKLVESLNLSKAMSQAIRDSRPGHIPIVCHRKAREPWHVTLLFKDLIEFCRIVVDATEDSKRDHP